MAKMSKPNPFAKGGPAAKPDPNAPVGQGGRFAAVQKNVEAEGKDPKAAAAIAASIGRKKFGNAKFAAMAAKGKK